MRERILAHRGHWASEGGLPHLKRNSLEAFTRASQLGFGIETDIRDRRKSIVISHDPFAASILNINSILELDFAGPIAFNVKSDGLSATLTTLLAGYFPVIDHFFFDMSIPETITYLDAQLPIAIRVSEYESPTIAGPTALWVDCFKSDWYLIENILPDFCTRYEKVVVVSPELHKRPHVETWEALSRQFLEFPNLLICTDYPLDFSKHIEGGKSKC